MLYQPPLPDEYHRMSDADVLERITARKAQLGRRAVILGHHYQADDIIRFADFTGDSFKLSKQAAEEARDAEFIVFCGVHFMAESADILAAEGQQVILPDLSAGCSMADMASLEAVLDAWDAIRSAADQPAVPICYMNSTAAIKAFCGRNGGIVCTSSNADRAMAWAMKESRIADCGLRIEKDTQESADPKSEIQDPRSKILFIPDQHLGRNTAYAMGWPLDSMVVWDPNQPTGGLTGQQIRDARLILWRGHCSVHQLFTPAQVDAVRAERPGIRVIVHPECPFEVVQKADQSGSTEQIIRAVEAAPPGSQWAVGTEIHLVRRLADRFAGVKHVQSLGDCQCLCTTMYRIDPPHLLWALDRLADGCVVNRIHVDAETKRWAKVALDRMLSLPRVG